MHDGKLHRWARDSSDHRRHGTAGSHLHLFRIETLSGEDYWEIYQLSIEPSSRGGGGGGGSASDTGVAGAGHSSSGTSGESGGGGEEDKGGGAGGWAAGRLHHVDVQPVTTEPRSSSGDAPTATAVANSSWLGLVDGDEFIDGGLAHHFLGPDGGWRLVRAKRVLLQLVLAQVGGIRVTHEGVGGWGAVCVTGCVDGMCWYPSEGVLCDHPHPFHVPS